jgi:hypothetical protein
VKNITITLVVLLALGAQNALAIDCAEFSVSIDGRCMAVYWIPWVAFGSSSNGLNKAGWQSWLDIGNIKTGTSQAGQIQIENRLFDMNGGETLYAVSGDDRIPISPFLHSNMTYPMNPGEKVRVKFLYPGTCNANGTSCVEQPNSLGVGSIRLRYFATDPAYLRDLQGALVTFLSKDPDGNFFWNATEPQVPAASGWKAFISDTADKQANPQGMMAASFAIANPGTAPVTVSATLYNKEGGLVATASTPIVLPAGGTTGVIVENLFGSAMYVGNADFVGVLDLEVTSPANGQVTAVVLQRVGNSMGNTGVTPVSR